MEEDIKTEDVGSEQPSEAPQNTGAVEIDWHDSFIRLYADFENFRKKKALEIDNIRRTAKKDLMIDLLPEGVNNILKMFNNILAKNGLAKYGNAGDKFNDAIYDAVNVSIDDNAPKGTIIDIVKYGYTLNDDIIRHAQVVVSN